MSHAFINAKGDYMLEIHDEILIEANPVAQLERERIIKLLEESDSVCNDWAIGIITGDVVSEPKPNEQDRITKLLEAEQQRTKLGFIQYQRIQELLNG